MTERDIATDPRPGDIVRSTKLKNSRERHVIETRGLEIIYLAVSPTNRRQMRCWLAPWTDWCRNNKVEVVRRAGGKDQKR